MPGKPQVGKHLSRWLTMSARLGAEGRPTEVAVGAGSGEATSGGRVLGATGDRQWRRERRPLAQQLEVVPRSVCG